MARKHPHLFANEIKGISPRTFGVELTGSGYGIVADITGISNDFPHTNPRNGYLYDRLLREYFRNCNNTVTDGLIHNDNLDLFPNSMDAGFTPNEYDNDTSYAGFFEYDPASNIQIITGTPLTTYSGHCITFNDGKPMFRHSDISLPSASLSPSRSPSFPFPCIQILKGSKSTNSVGLTGFYRRLQLTGVKFNTPESKGGGTRYGGPIKKVYLDNKGKSKTQDIFFRDSFTGYGNINGSPNRNAGTRIDPGELNSHFTGIDVNGDRIFGRPNLHNDFLDLGRNGTFSPLATGMNYSRTLKNSTSLAKGFSYKLLFARVHNGKIIEHLQPKHFPISGISYLDLFEQNFDVPKGDGVHVFVFNFGKVKIRTNQNAVGGGSGPTIESNSADGYWKNFQQSGNPNAEFTGGRIDFSAFNLYTAKLD